MSRNRESKGWTRRAVARRRRHGWRRKRPAPARSEAARTAASAGRFPISASMQSGPSFRTGRTFIRSRDRESKRRRDPGRRDSMSAGRGCRARDGAASAGGGPEARGTMPRAGGRFPISAETKPLPRGGVSFYEPKPGIEGLDAPSGRGQAWRSRHGLASRRQPEERFCLSITSRYFSILTILYILSIR